MGTVTEKSMRKKKQSEKQKKRRKNTISKFDELNIGKK